MEKVKQSPNLTAASTVQGSDANKLLEPSYAKRLAHVRKLVNDNPALAARVVKQWIETNDN